MFSGAICRLSARSAAVCGIAAVALSTCGCQVGRKWFQIDSNSRSPVMGIELRAEAGDDVETPEQAASEALPVEHVESEPRRGLRDWLGFPRGEERIPLPTTMGTGDDGEERPLTGPRPEFE